MITKIKDEKYELLLIIESLRKEMIETATLEGFTSERTIQISQKLDDYIAKYQICSRQIK